MFIKQEELIISLKLSKEKIEEMESKGMPVIVLPGGSKRYKLQLVKKWINPDFKEEEEVLKIEEQKTEEVNKNYFYALIKNKEILYIGATKNHKLREKDHKKRIDFDDYVILEEGFFTKEQRIKREDYYIKKNDPVLNHRLGKGGIYFNPIEYYENNNIDLDFEVYENKIKEKIKPLFNENYKKNDLDKIFKINIRGLK